MADLVLRHATTAPERVALVETGRRGARRVGYGALGRRASAYAAGLRALGIRPGDRVVVLVPPSVELYALLVGLFSAGIVAVVVDGTLGPRRLGRAVADARPAAVVAAGWLVALARLIPALRRVRCIRIEDSAFAPPPPRAGVLPAARPLRVGADAPAVVSFTSGSTGRPKGAIRTHGMLIAQHLALRSVFRDRPDEVGLTLFPLVGLHHLCCGHTVVLPTRGRCRTLRDAEGLLRLVRDHRVTALSAGPAALDRMTAALEGRGARVWDVRHVISGGGPVGRRLCRRVLRAFPGAAARVVYGSTEAEPVASVPMAEVAEAAGAGYLVGALVPAAEVELVRLTETAPTLDAAELRPWRVGAGEHGEVVVRGAHVVRGYFENPEADAATKVRGPGGTWHRTGDLARLDDRGRLWLSGRAGDLVTHGGAVLRPLEVEAELDDVPALRRAALIQHRDRRRAVLAIELERRAGREAIEGVRRRLGDLGLAGVAIRPVRRIPMDARHGSKVDRGRLRRRLERRWPRG